MPQDAQEGTLHSNWFILSCNHWNLASMASFAAVLLCSVACNRNVGLVSECGCLGSSTVVYRRTGSCAFMNSTSDEEVHATLAALLGCALAHCWTLGSIGRAVQTLHRMEPCNQCGLFVHCSSRLIDAL